MLITNAAVFRNGKIFENTDVRTDDEGRIQEVSSNLKRSRNEPVIEAKGHSLLPGLIDAHVHISSDGQPTNMDRLQESSLDTTLKAARNAWRNLYAGITTVRSLGGPAGVEIAISKAVRSGVVMGARVIPAGQVLCITGGHGHLFGREIDGADEARKAAREQLKAGAEVIKVIATGGILTAGVNPGQAQLTFEEIKAAVDVAHAAGKKVAAHAQGTQGIENAIRAGVDSIEHGIFLTEELIALMKEKKIYLVPTLTASKQILAHGEKDGVPDYAVAKAKEVAAIRQKNIRMAIEAGVKIAFGTDAGTPFNRHGHNTDELLLLQEYGLTPLQVLQAATFGSAENVGLQETIGRIEPGYAADLLLVAGDVFTDLTNLQTQIQFVCQNGRIIRSPEGPLIPDSIQS